MPNKRKRIAVVTGSRADYGLLFWLLKEMQASKSIDLKLIVTGMHLEKNFGLTYKEILKDKFTISARVPIRLRADSDIAITDAVGLGVSGMGRVLKDIKPDLLVVLGDRFEMFAAASAGMLHRIPMAHIHGGEVTKGAYDDAMRHALTKMASIHFTINKTYSHRIIRMGEHPKYVFTVGSPGVDHIYRLRLLSLEELEKDLGMTLDKEVAVVTMHSVTLLSGQAKYHIQELLEALRKTRLRFIFTQSNADAENGVIYQHICQFVKQNPSRAKLVSSLGHLRYLSLMKYVGMMIGNSSSGIIEAPYFKLPVINIGQRQEGRIKAKNIIDCAHDRMSISRAIVKASSPTFRDSLKTMSMPFGNGKAAKSMCKVLETIQLDNILQKGFYE